MAPGTASATGGASLPEATYSVQHEDSDLVVDKGRLALCARCRADKARLPASRLRAGGYRKSSMRRTASTATPLACSLWAAQGRSPRAVQGLRGAIGKELRGARGRLAYCGRGEVHHHIGKRRRQGDAFASFRLVEEGGAQTLHDGRYRAQHARRRHRPLRVALEPVTGRPHQLRLRAP